MEILYLNITGIVLLISFAIFIIKFYKNHNVIDKNVVDEVKMNVKIYKETQPEFNYDSYNKSNNSKQNLYTSTGMTSLEKISDVNLPTPNIIKKILYIKLPTPNIITDSRLKYLGDYKDGSTIYAMLPEDLKYLPKVKFTIIDNNNINSTLRDGKDYTKANTIKSLRDSILKQKNDSDMY